MTAHQHQFARGLSLLPACAIGGRRSPLLPASAATLIRYDQPQMGTDTALGRRFGMCRLALAVGRTGGFGRLGCFTEWFLPLFDVDLKLGRCLGIGRSLNRNGFGVGCNRYPFAINTYAADHSRNHAVQPLKRHFSVSVRYVTTRSEAGGQIAGTRGQREHRPI